MRRQLRGFINTYLTALQHEPLIAESLEIETRDFRIAGLGVISGMFYSSRVAKDRIFLLRKEFYGKEYRKHPFWKYVDPEHPHVLESMPKTFCITSEGDFLRSNTHSFVSAMKKAGKSVTLLNYPDKSLQHDFVCMFPKVDETQDSLDKLAAFWNSVEVESV